MARFDDDAICLRQWDWSETSQTVLLFTREHGLVRALAKGSRRPKSAFDGGLEPLTRGIASATGKPGAGLLTLTGWSLGQTYPGIRRSYGAFLAGGVAADACRRLFEVLDPHPPAFDALAGALAAIDSGAAPGESGADRDDGAGIVRPLAVLLTALLVETGLFPDLGPAEIGLQDRRGDEVLEFAPTQGSLRAGGSRGSAGQGHEQETWPIRAATVRRLRAYAGGQPGHAEAAGSGRTDLGCLRFLVAWVRYRTGSDLPAAAMLLDRVSVLRRSDRITKG